MGGHIYHRPGRGKSATTCITEKLHDNNTTRGLECLGNWLINIAQTTNSKFKEKLLIETFKTLLSFTSVLEYTDNSTQAANTLTNKEKISIDKPPSLFMINILFMRNFKKNEIKFKQNDFENFGHVFSQKLWKS